MKIIRSLSSTSWLCSTDNLIRFIESTHLASLLFVYFALATAHFISFVGNILVPLFQAYGFETVLSWNTMNFYSIKCSTIHCLSVSIILIRSQTQGFVALLGKIFTVSRSRLLSAHFTFWTHFVFSLPVMNPRCFACDYYRIDRFSIIWEIGCEWLSLLWTGKMIRLKIARNLIEICLVFQIWIRENSMQIVNPVEFEPFWTHSVDFNCFHQNFDENLF